MIERRREPRTDTGFSLHVWGIDKKGIRFSQEVQASNTSVSGALISQLHQELKPGDLIGVALDDKKARFRVVWVRNSGTRNKVQAAIHRVNGDQCPWLDLLPAAPTAASAPISSQDEPPTPPTPS
jgi:hypothetical protein